MSAIAAVPAAERPWLLNLQAVLGERFVAKAQAKTDGASSALS